MRSNKFRILALTLVTILGQATFTYAASSSNTYTKEELDDLTPGWSKTSNINKSNYKTNSYTNTFSSIQNGTSKEEDDTEEKTNSKAAKTSSIESTPGNIIVSTVPSTGNYGDAWARTSTGKWILLENGVPASGWRMVRGRWYYMDADGVMQTGWVNYNNSWYYLNAGGDMAYNTYVDGYYLDSSGAMQ